MATSPSRAEHNQQLTRKRAKGERDRENPFCFPFADELLPYQIEDILKVCDKWNDRSVYLGHEMGLGKTVIAIMCCQRLEANNILVVCPASVRGVWKGEFQRWTNWGGWLDWRILPATITEGRQRIHKGNKYTRIANIVSYDLVTTPKIGKQILKQDWDIIIFDECHALGNPKSKRSRACLGSFYPKAKKCLFLSGSIQQDKIINVWPVFKTLCPEYIPSYWQFVNQYIYTKRTKYGIKFLGGKNLKGLGRIARSHFLIRRTKKGVLAELPEKLEQRILVQLPEIEQKRNENAARDFGGALEATLEDGNVLQGEMSTMLRELGESKVQVALETILELLGLGSSEESCGKLVVFCYHLSVYHELRKKLGGHTRVVGICGETTAKRREGCVEVFQKESDCKVFLGTYAAAEGITLTAASTVLFVEPSWRLSHIEQAQDRLHRIGQKNTVWIKYLLVEGSLDEIVYNVYKRKSYDKRRLLGE